MLRHLSTAMIGTLCLSVQIAEAMDCPANFDEERSSFLSRMESLDYVIIMRHADKGGDDQLTGTGEDQTRAIARAFGEDEDQIPAQNVIANIVDRTCDTARQAFDVGDGVCREIRHSTNLEELALSEKRGTIIVTHSGHIRDWFGWSLACGEAAIIERTEGSAVCLHRVLPNEWLGQPFSDELFWQHCDCPTDALRERTIDTDARCSIG